ncbi:alpha/beta fold hydrolase [Lentzea sp. NPDC059081]|uniref:alpha/beta fold hydrolase n=1 Tax=Lentzea sp. NPDC059081 TaxID=3346719 RepID=UPI00369440A1
MTEFVTSVDGTRVAYTVIGTGPALVIVNGALCYRKSGPSTELSGLLARHFTVYDFDRRGRGETGDGVTPWSLEREVEDIGALVERAGGTAFVFAFSSGSALALEAASRLSGIERLVVFEAPFVVDDTHEPLAAGYAETIDDLIARDERSAALTSFMKLVGIPAFVIGVMKRTPLWKKHKRIAHTLAHDVRIMGQDCRGVRLPAGRWPGATMPVLALAGSRSPVHMRNAMVNVSEALADAEYQPLKGQNHVYQPAAMAPVLVEYFTRTPRVTTTPRDGG